MKSLKENKVIALGTRKLGFIWDYEEVRRTIYSKLGLKVVRKDYNYLKKFFEEANIENAREKFQIVKLYSKTSEGELVDAFKLYLALKDIINVENAIGVTMNCLGERFEGKYGLVYPCLAFSLLQGEGIACSCEGDVISMATLALLNRFLEEPCFMTNILPLSLLPRVAERLGIPVQQYDPSRTILLGHCSYLGIVPFPIASKIFFKTRFDKISSKGVVVDAEIPPSEITLAKFSPLFDTIRVIPGYLKEVARFTNRSIAVVEVEDSYKVAEKLYSYHVIVILGDKRRELKILSKALKVKYEEIE